MTLTWIGAGPLTCPHCHGLGVLVHYNVECPHCYGMGGWRNVLVQVADIDNEREGKELEDGMREQDDQVITT